MILRVLMTLGVLAVCTLVGGCGEETSDNPAARERDTSGVTPVSAPGSGGTEGSRSPTAAPGGGGGGSSSGG